LLLYNQRKEFVGIDADDLSGLGFSNLNELLSESNDFADLFVKKPGYIHNFKNFSWIDFILHSETGESKAIIHAKGKNYSCVLHVAGFHFVSEDGGFAVLIKNIRALKGAEDSDATQSLEASGGIQATPIATPSPAPKAAEIKPQFDTPSIEEERPSLDISLEDMQLDEPYAEAETSEPELPNFGEDLELSEPDLLDIPETPEIELASDDMDEDEAFELALNHELGAPTENEFGAPVDLGAPLDIIDDLSLGYDEEPEVQEALPIIEEPAEAPMLGDYVSSSADSEHLSELITSGTYVYDPHIAADELGLPVDLIEEFIGDFIDQAHEFRDDLYASVNSNDFDNVQILSHKLKGVAANLRVEDAFDTLSVVNVSKDTQEILPNLNQFYKIIAKLEGKEVAEEIAVVEPTPEPIPTAIDDIDIALASDSVATEEPEMAIDIKQPDEGPMLVHDDVAPMDEDDLYGNLLATPEEEVAEFTESESAEDDDLYGDLLSTPEEEIAAFAAPEPAMEDDLYDDLLSTSETPSFEEEAVAPLEEELDDNLYDDLLATPQTETFEEVAPVEEEIEIAPVAEVEVPTLNFDVDRAANELGIPLDVVNEFVQDFKSQVASHQADFDMAISADDLQGVKKTATLLKGMSDNLRLNDISEVLKSLQQASDTSNIQDNLATLQAYANQL